MAALDNHLIHADNLNQFEREFVLPMRNKRDKLWENMKISSTPEAEKEYDMLNSRVCFLDNVLLGGRTVVKESAVIVEYGQRLLTAWEEGKAGAISKSVKKFKEVTA